jgi:hypothetical protein
VSDSGADPFAGILKDNLLCAGVVCEFALYDYAESTQFKKNVGALHTVNMDGLRVSRHAKARDQDRELRIDYLFAVPLLRHL